MADKIFYSECIYDGKSDIPFEGGVAITGNTITAVGKREEIDKYKEENTEVFECGNKMIMPGMFENHMHFFMGAMAASKYSYNDLLSTTSEEDCVKKMAEFRDKNPGLSKYVGNGWLTINWNNAPTPTKHSLDKEFPDVPVYMLSADCHTLWMNSKALEEFETDEISPNIERFPNGELTGIFKEDKSSIPTNRAYEFPEGEAVDIQKNMMYQLNKCGITSAAEMSGGFSIVDLDPYKELSELDKDGEMSIRLHLYAGITDVPIDKALERYRKMQKEFNSDVLSTNGFKAFADGVSATFTAAMLEPYTDRPDTSGAFTTSPEELSKVVAAANLEGIPVRIHACGDAAVRASLDAYEAAKKKGAAKEIKNAIEHIDIMSKEDIHRFKELNVTASVQPCHVPQDQGEKIIRNGLERCKYEWPFRSLIDSGADFVVGTDYPVETFNPFKNIYMAITRCSLDGECKCANPEQAMTLQEALKGYTLNGAALHDADEIVGSLEAGKYADLVVLDRNLYEIPVEDIKDTEVLFTVMNGKIVYSK